MSSPHNTRPRRITPHPAPKTSHTIPTPPPPDGGAALAALLAISRLKLPVRVIGMLGLVENMTGGRAMKLGDVLRSRKGVTIEVQNRNTNAGVKLLDETRSANAVDIFWASAPDAFEVLKKNSLLQKYQPKAQGLASKVGVYPVNDPQGFYVGFAASGYGIMFNTRYTRANGLPAPKEWDDLKKPVYHGHIGISAPSRSGTTHLTVETILQGEGWDKGWRSIKEMAGNFRQVTERIWLVSFMDYDLGYFDDETCRLEPIQNPFGSRVLPMSSE